LRREVIELAVADEVQTYVRVFGEMPVVVVPPTFVWSPEVEWAWAAHGLQCVVTPGQRFVQRDRDGGSVADGAHLANGDRHGELVYLARSDYFEPIKGRDAAYALHALRRAIVESRACILENHRVNFCRDTDTRRRSLAELDALLRGALSMAPNLCFLSSAALLRVVRDRDANWIDVGRRERLTCWWQRLQTTGRLWRLLRISGATLLVGLWLRRLRRPEVVGYG
jgi:hypothetical protein